MNTIIEFLTEGSIPLIAGVLSCVSSILYTCISKSILKRLEKGKDTHLKIKINDKEMTIEGYSPEEILELLAKLEPKDETQNQSEEDTTLKPKDQTQNQSEEDIT